MTNDGAFVSLGVFDHLPQATGRQPHQVSGTEHARRTHVRAHMHPTVPESVEARHG